MFLFYKKMKIFKKLLYKFFFLINNISFTGEKRKQYTLPIVIICKHYSRLAPRFVEHTKEGTDNLVI